MKKKFRIFMAAALSAGMTFAGAAAGSAAEASSEAQAPEDVRTIESELPLGQAGDILGQAEEALTKAQAGTVRIEYGDFLQKIAEQEGEDISWLKSITLDGVGAGSDDGFDMSGSIALNDTPLYDVQISAGQDGKLYFCLPQLNETPAVVDLQEIFTTLMDAETGDGQGTVGDIAGKAADQVSELATDLETLADSISEQEISDFVDRYAGIISEGITVGTAEQTTVKAGSLSVDASAQSVSIQPEAMDKILQSSAAELKNDPLILKVLGSDFTADIVKMAAESEGQSSAPVTVDQVIAAYQQFIEQNLSTISGAPGFSVSVANDSAGKLVNVTFKLIYSGVEIPVFVLSMIHDGTQNAYQFDLGEMIASAITSAAGSDTSSGESGSSSQTTSGPTGLLAEGSTDGGKFNETITIRSQGQAVFTVGISDFDTAKFQAGQLDGSIDVDLGGTPVSVQFASTDPNSQDLSIYVADSLLMKESASARDADESEIKKIDKTSAVKLSSEEDLENYFKDVDEQKLKDDLVKAGVPQEVIDSLSEEQQSETTTAA